MKVKLKDMSYADRQRYRYYRRLLSDLRIYGAHFLKKQAKRTVADIEEKYSKELK